MTTLALKNELFDHVSRLPVALQSQVLQFARALEMTTQSTTPGSELASFIGCIPPEDLNLMTEAIAEGCERVDVHEW